MYDLVREYINLKVAALNTGVTNPLVENDIFLEMEEMPANKKTYTYAVKFDSYDRKDDNETDAIYPVNVTIELNFGLFKKGLTEYENIIDDYVQPLAKLLSVSNSTGANIAYVSGNIALIDINKMSIEGLNDIVENSYLQPKIKFEITVIDQDTVPVVTVGVPVLSTPADLATVTTGNTPFQWGDVTDADNYEISITDGTTTLAQKSLVSSYTVPADSTLTDGSYTWTARAWIGGLKSAWATTQTFTVAIPSVSYEDETLAYVARMSVAPSTTWKDNLNDFIVSAKAHSYWSKLNVLVIPSIHFTQADSLLNIKSSSYNGTLIGAPSFVAYRGWTGGAGKAIDTNYNSNLSNQNSFCMFFLSRTDQTVTEIEMGILGGGVDNRIACRIGNAIYMGANQATATGITYVGDTIGLYMCNRINSTQIKISKRGILYSTTTVNSVAPINANYYVLCVNNGVGGIGLPSTKQCGAYGFAETLTDAETVSFNTDLRIMLDAYGAGI